MNIEDAQRKYDKERETSYCDEDRLCLRCNEEEAEDGEDYCYICEEVIKEKNRDRFIEKETY
jgi:hypothetical protein